MMIMYQTTIFCSKYALSNAHFSSSYLSYNVAVEIKSLNMLKIP